MRRLFWISLISIVFAPAAARAQSEEVVYYHTDAIGSVRMITDPTGTVIARYDFTPFGQPWDPPGTVEPMQFTGQQHDLDTQLDYFIARDFLSLTGRFTTPDDPSYMNPFDPQSMNRFAYGYNNPFRYNDPTGHQVIEVLPTNPKTDEAGFTVPPWGPWLGFVDTAAQVQQAAVSVTSKVEKLVDCTSDQLGLHDLVAGSAVAAGQPIPGTKAFRTPGSSTGTSLAGKVADAVFGDMRLSRAVRLPVGGLGTGTALRLGRTKVVARAAARFVPWAGWAMLAGDATVIGYCMAN